MSENRSHIKTKEKQKVFETISKQLLSNQNAKLLPLLIEEYFFNAKEVNGFGVKKLKPELSVFGFDFSFGFRHYQ